MVTRLPDVVPPAVCPALVCNADGTCPTCNGITPDCDANNDCFYVRRGGGGGGSPPVPEEPNVIGGGQRAAAPTDPGVCSISLCDVDGNCPSCAGQAGVCDADSICRYPGTGGGGGGGGGGGPFCNAAVCNEDQDCANICPRSQNPRCINFECAY